MGWSEDPGPSQAGKFPAASIYRYLRMKELSVFIDESGDFGEYEIHSPYYIISMVCHDQAESIDSQIDKLNMELGYMNLDKVCIHTGPIIRREEIYNAMTIRERRRIFNKMVAFIRSIEFKYECFHIEKKKIDDPVEVVGALSKQISSFIRDHFDEFLSFDIVKVYYDNGQVEVSKMLASVFNAMLPRVEFRRVLPIKYKLFQVADLLCSMELIRLKMESKGLSKSEMTFFGSIRDLKKNYLKQLGRKRWK